MYLCTKTSICVTPVGVPRTQALESRLCAVWRASKVCHLTLFQVSDTACVCVCVLTCSRECCPVCHYLPVTGCRMWSIDCSAGTSQSSSLSRVHAVSSPGLLHNYRVSHTVMFTASLSICLYHVPVSWLLRSGLRPPNSPPCARRASQTRGHTRYVTRGSALDSVGHRVYTGNCTVEMLQPSLVSNHLHCYPCAWVVPRDRATLARVLCRRPRVRAFRQLAHGNNDHSVCTLNRT